MVGATKLLYLQINDLSLEAGFKSGKAASESGIIAAPPVYFTQSKQNQGHAGTYIQGRRHSS